MSAARLSLTFRIFRGDQLVREETLTQGVIKIGKVPSAHLRIDDDSVSRMHAILEVDQAGDVHLIDLGSTRGTFINGHKVNKAKLESGDAITLGAIRVEVAFKRIDLSPVAQAPTVVVAMPPPIPTLPTPIALPMAAAPAPATPIAPAPVALPAPMMRALAAPMPFAKSAIDDEVGAKAIEVAAMLGDSVVGVKHCIDPKSGKVTAATWGFFAVGAMFLVMSAVAFASSVATAAFNKGGLEYWTHVAHKPAYSFRPETLGLGYDWLAFGGAGMGLVAVIAGLMRMRKEKRTPYFRIGTAPGVELALEGAPAASFPLVAPSADGDDFVFNYGAGIEGEMIVDGKSTPLAELAATGRARPSMTTAGAIEVPIPARARIRARSGLTTFMVSAVPQPRQYTAPLLASLENRTMAYFAGSLAVHLGIWALLNTIPADDSSANIEVGYIETIDNRIDGIEKETTPPPVDPNDSGGGDSTGDANMALGPEGASGTDVAQTDHHSEVKHNNDEPPQIARAKAIEEARKAGILGEASALNDGFDNVLLNAKLTNGFDDATFYGSLFGADGGPSHGSFGMGRSGFYAGGGCTQEPCGLYGSGTRYNTIGGGQHTGQGWNGPGGFGPGQRRHVGGVPNPVIGQPIGGGDLDKAIIRRYIKRNISKIGYCYEHELLAHPSIEGTITVSFFITPMGAVKGAVGAGFDSTVASCVADVIGNIEFPKPNGGGGVQVNYPFTFHTASAAQ